MSGIQRILLLPHIKVHNANALSSPFTIGFPAMTAWLGAMHALQRLINGNGLPNLKFKSMAIISHDIKLQTHKGFGDFVYSIVGTGNPLDEHGKRPSFIEEARCHLDVSLVIEYTEISKRDEDKFIELITHHLHASMKIAGGDIISFQNPTLDKVEEGKDTDLQRLTRKLMPGYAIIERRELMTDAMKQGQDAIAAMLDYLVIHNSCDKDDNNKVIWKTERKTSGWIVPIAVGFHGITELAQAKNQRNVDTPHRFAESLVTLGEFRMPHRINSLNEILWHYYAELNNNLYLCQQNNRVKFNQ